MNDLQPLLALLAHAERERDSATAQRQRARMAQESAQSQADQLLGYRGDYERRWGAQFALEGKIELLHCYQGFMERLTLAVEQQRRIADHAAVQLERAQAALIEQELKVASVRKLIERRMHERRLQADRRDQKQTDEFAARAAWNAGAGAGALRLA
jgi:flagellar FliJ protein